jgi:hypothetical protein
MGKASRALAVVGAVVAAWWLLGVVPGVGVATVLCVMSSAVVLGAAVGRALDTARECVRDRDRDSGRDRARERDRDSRRDRRASAPGTSGRTTPQPPWEDSAGQTPRPAGPALKLAVSLMAAHCLFYYGLALEEELGGTWQVRVPYGSVASPIAATCVLALGILAVVCARRWLRRTSRPLRLRAKVACVACAAIWLTATLAVSAWLLLVALFDYDGTERVLQVGGAAAIGVEPASAGGGSASDGVGPEATSGGPAAAGVGSVSDDAVAALLATTRPAPTYLAVDWAGYQPDESRTLYYRAFDPFLMESWPSARTFDHVGTPAASSQGEADGHDGASAQGGDGRQDVAGGQDGAGEQGEGDAGAAADAAAGSDSAAASAADAAAIAPPSDVFLSEENQMLAVCRYVEDAGVVPEMDALAFGANAKGELYASLGTATELVSGDAVTVEYRLYGNGEKTGADGAPAEEYVLQRLYPHGESVTELVGFYLVVPETLRVTDERRTSW